MNATEKATLDRFKELVQQRLPLHKMVLFGSRARGDANPESDVDVLVILSGPADSAERDSVSECAWEAGFEQGIVVVPVTVSRSEWEDGPLSSSLLAIAVEREGVLV